MRSVIEIDGAGGDDGSNDGILLFVAGGDLEKYRLRWMGDESNRSQNNTNAPYAATNNRNRSTAAESDLETGI